MVNQKNKCPVCKSSLVTMFLTRENIPVHQNIVAKDCNSATEVVRGDLNLVVCEKCGFIFNKSFEPSKLSYGKHYDNTQACSPSFNDYLTGIAHHLLFECGVKNCRIVEVGCGNGLFLRKLVEVEEYGNSGYGFDPSYVGPATDFEGRLKFEKCYYGPKCVDIPADVIVCRHVIEHVPDPVDLLHTIKQAVTNSPHARIFFETPCVEWILHNQVIWDFFYEHCSYFTADSLTTAFESAGFRIENVHHVFGGQYLWLEATISIEKPVVIKNSGLIPNLAKKFASTEHEIKRKWVVKIQKLAAKKKIALWGAGAKGVTFANSIDPERKWIDCLIDLNPKKQGHYVSGTGHPIVSYQEFAKRGGDVAILMNPNYYDECLALLREEHLNINLIK